MAGNSKSWQLTLTTALSVWAAIVLLVSFWGIWLGFGGGRFAIALGVAAFLFAFEFFLAAPSFLNEVQRLFGTRGTILAPFDPLFAILIYSFGVSGDWKLMLLGAAYAVAPALLVASSTGKSPGTWEDYAALVLIWLPVQFQWMYRRIFLTRRPLTHTLTILMALSTV